MNDYVISYDSNWGMPTISAASFPLLCEGLGYSQAQQHPNLMLSSYLRAIGRSAEFLGAHSGPGPNALTKQPLGVDFIASDRAVRQMRIPDIASEWLEQQDAEIFELSSAFCKGINQCRSDHPELFDPRFEAFGPVGPEHVIAQITQIFLGFQSALRMPTVLEWTQGKALVNPTWHDFAGAGSNGCVVGPSKSVNGNPMLIVNPHTQWNVDVNTISEARLELTDDSGYVFHGAGFIGVPVLMFGCNADIGWGTTVNTQNGITFFDVELDGEAVSVDDKPLPVNRDVQSILCLEPDGSRSKHQQEVIWSERHQASAIAQRDGRHLLINFGCLKEGQGLRQLYDMMRASSMSEYKQALAQHQIPFQNLMFAGRDLEDGAAHIRYDFLSLAPQRNKGTWADWWNVQDGHRSENIPSGVIPAHQLFSDEDATSGFYQNCNGSPYAASAPSPFDSGDFPDWLSPVYENFRGQSITRLLTETEQFDLEELIKVKFSTRVEFALRTVPQLLEAIPDDASAALLECKRVLAAWDKHTNTDSRGAYLFLRWVLALDLQDAVGTPLFEDAWDYEAAKDSNCWRNALETPGKIADMKSALSALEAAAEKVFEEHGFLDVAWGDALGLVHDQHSIPAVGGPGDPLGVFSAVPIPAEMQPFIKGGTLPSNRMENEGGETFVMVAEFTPFGVRGGTLVSYGNSSIPGHRHNGDQLKLIEQRELRRFEIRKSR